MKQIFQRYALALFWLAQEENQISEFMNECQQILKIFAKNPDFMQLIKNDVLKKEEKKVLLAMNKPAGIVCTAEKRERNNRLPAAGAPDNREAPAVRDPAGDRHVSGDRYGCPHNGLPGVDHNFRKRSCHPLLYFDHGKKNSAVLRIKLCLSDCDSKHGCRRGNRRADRGIQQYRNFTEGIGFLRPVRHYSVGTRIHCRGTFGKIFRQTCR